MVFCWMTLLSNIFLPNVLKTRLKNFSLKAPAKGSNTAELQSRRVAQLKSYFIWIHSDLVWSILIPCDILINSDPFWSILINSDPFWSILIHFDQFWSILINPNPFWSILIYSNQFWSILINSNGQNARNGWNGQSGWNAQNVWNFE